MSYKSDHILAFVFPYFYVYELIFFLKPQLRLLSLTKFKHMEFTKGYPGVQDL